MILMAKFLTPVDVGMYALALAITAPLQLLSNMQLATVQATDARHTHPFGEYLGTRLATTTLALLLLAAGTLLISDGPTARVVLAMAVAKGVESVSDVTHGFFQQIETMSHFGRSFVLKGCATLLAIAAGVLVWESVLVAILLMAGGWSLVLFAHDLPIARRELGVRIRGQVAAAFRPTLRNAPQIVRMAAPLGVVSLLDSLMMNMPRYFLQGSLGEAAVGFYSAAAYFLVASSMVIAALARSARPRLASLYLSDFGAFRRLTGRLVLISLVVGAGSTAGALLLGRRLLTFFYTPEYAEYGTVLVLLMAGGTLWYMAGFVGSATLAARRFREQPPIFLTATVTTALGALVLVPNHGAEGAAVALTFGFLVRLLLSWRLFAGLRGVQADGGSS